MAGYSDRQLSGARPDVRDLGALTQREHFDQACRVSCVILLLRTEPGGDCEKRQQRMNGGYRTGLLTHFLLSTFYFLLTS